MEKFGKIYRESVQKALKNDFEKSNSVFIIGYQGVDAVKLGSLHQDLRGVGARLFVSKNSLVKIALPEIIKNRVLKFIEGPTAFIFAKDDIVSTSKVLKEFNKENKILIVRGGLLKETVLQTSDIESLANLPSREVLLIMAVIGLKSPINNFVLLLNQMLVRFVIVIKAISDKKK